LKNPSEAEVDAWFAARSVQRADIRLQISPFAKQHWLGRFLRYTSGLEKELADYDAVLNQAYGAADMELSPANRRVALGDAYEAFFTPTIHLGEVARMHCLYRHALAILVTFYPPPEEYKLPPLDDEDYNLLAPLPERAALARSTSPARDEVPVVNALSQRDIM
jgi:hypothetical protein